MEQYSLEQEIVKTHVTINVNKTFKLGGYKRIVHTTFLLYLNYQMITQE